MWLFWENQSLTLPAFVFVHRLPFNSVVDIGDIHPVDECPAKLHPRVHHHLSTKTVLRHITHLFDGSFWLYYDYYTSNNAQVRISRCLRLLVDLFTSLHISSSSVVSTTCNRSVDVPFTLSCFSHIYLAQSIDIARWISFAWLVAKAPPLDFQNT